jgi:[NiFe] hydrogenase small subunit
MKLEVGLARDGAEERLKDRGISRRDFMKFCGGLAVFMGLESSCGAGIAQALTSPRRPSVVYLHNAECTGCSEAVLRTVQPYIDELLLDTISLDYHETLMAAAGEAAEAALHQALQSPHGYICVIEGGIPTKDQGLYGKLAGKTMLQMCREVAPGAKVVIAIGNCAAFGGVQAAKPNPTGAKGVNEALKDLQIKAVNVSGCPPNPYNFIGTVVHYLTKGLPALDALRRPLPFYGQTVHDQCPRLSHFEKEEYALSFGSEEARKGWCLYKLGCKGPDTFNNCPKVLFNQTNFPMGCGHPCLGCSEPDFWDTKSPFYEAG